MLLALVVKGRGRGAAEGGGQGARGTLGRREGQSGGRLHARLGFELVAVSPHRPGPGDLLATAAAAGDLVVISVIMVGAVVLELNLQRGAGHEVAA